jgi:phosphate:Na+ symporter
MTVYAFVIASEVSSREVGGYINESVEPMRDTIASSVVDGKIDVPEATDCLEALRWMERVSHHVARIALHLQQARLASGK